MRFSSLEDVSFLPEVSMMDSFVGMREGNQLEFSVAIRFDPSTDGISDSEEAEMELKARDAYAIAAKAMGFFEHPTSKAQRAGENP